MLIPLCPIDTDTTLSLDDYLRLILEMLQGLQPDLEVEQELPEVVPSVPEIQPSDFQFDLKNIFPFCIPFDLYDILSLLRSERVTPVVTFRLYVPNIIDYDIVVDLSPFESMAEILRVMLDLLFVVGLALETKNLIKW